ncbi:hypothetical protein K469DRAFT_714573 [Zopfia rhizophila CBS 207.26]|uniref:Uncharacterized protein n=1 Tax=Zopfia rhizophila CBS 207.26 TaxID=1314779 RepID=A0A6A6DQH2_9PEZI|nr:hypothetical protein K469DRAFT_714573 [Zopfia rhizophila CBS 207.26]
MPRPKRTKVASSTARVAQSSQAAAPIVRRNVTKQVSDRVDSISDDSDGLVAKTTRVRSRMPWHPEPQKDVDLTMTGALPMEDDTDADELESTALSPPANVPSTDCTKSTSSVLKKTQKHSAQSKKMQPAETPAHKSRQATLSTRDAPEDEGDSLPSDNLFTFDSLDSDSPAHGTRPPSAMKGLGTPAHETSILALANFKRRARQPSLLRMVHQTTDMEDNGLDDLDDFNPQDESTPLHVQKSGLAEDASDSSVLSVPSSSCRGTKRKLASPEVQVPRSSPPFNPPSGADVEESPSSPSLPDDIIVSREDIPVGQEQVEPEVMSETMAPPKSSSPLVEEVVESPIKPHRTRAKRKETKQISRYRRDSGSEDEEPKQPAKSKSKQKPKAARFSTAKLQALLPRRRTCIAQEHDEFEIPDSDEVDATPVDSDQDELQMASTRVASTTRKTAPSTLIQKASRNAKKSSMPTGTAKQNARTYGNRRTSSDKENESTFVLNESSEDVEETTETTINLPKNSLAAIAKKFEEVDAWEMEFESVDVEGGSSSPWR